LIIEADNVLVKVYRAWWIGLKKTVRLGGSREALTDRGKNTAKFDRVRDKVWVPELYIKTSSLTFIPSLRLLYLEAIVIGQNLIAENLLDIVYILLSKV